MRFMTLICSNLRRKKARTLLTLLSITVSFFLFGLLGALRYGFTAGVDIAGLDRLMMMHKVSLLRPLPLAYKSRIEATDGVAKVTHSTWFGGTYQDPKNFFPRLAVDHESYLSVFTEYVVSEAHQNAWRSDRLGVIAGRGLLQRFGWTIGDVIPIMPDIWPREGGGPWEFRLVGTYDAGKPGTDLYQLFFRYDYFDESRANGKGLVGWYNLRVTDRKHSAEIAKYLDGLFANSAYETKTASQKIIAQSFANQVGDIGAIVTAILSAVFFTILLVTGNTMAQSVRERTGELGVLKAIGFQDSQVMGLVLAESFLLSAIGAAVGLGLAALSIPAIQQSLGDSMPIAGIPSHDLLLGIVFAFLLGLITGFLPGFQAMRLRIVDALRRAR